jgi:hypothetical protein
MPFMPTAPCLNAAPRAATAAASWCGKATMPNRLLRRLKHGPLGPAVAAVLAMVAMAASGSAQAVPVSPEATVFLPGTTLADRPDLVGKALYDDMLDIRIGHPIAPAAIFAGWQVRQQVVRSDLTGALVFTAQLQWQLNITPARFLVDAVWLDGWGAFATDVDYRTDLDGDRGPSWATRSADGQRLALEFGFPLVSGNLVGDPQEDSRPMIIATDATAFANTGALTVVGRFDDRPDEVFYGRVEGLAVPVRAPVPEPAAWVLMALGIAAMAVFRWSVPGVAKHGAPLPRNSLA